MRSKRASGAKAASSALSAGANGSSGRAAVSQRKRLATSTKRRASGWNSISETGTIASCRFAARICRSSGSVARSFTASALDPLDLGTAGAELLDQPLIAAVEMVDAVEHRLALRRETGQHQRHRR